jgi:quercetin dioxygenase-like cupin family protein
MPRLLFYALLAASLLPAQPNILLENDQVRVVLSANKPGNKGRRHKHDRNRVMIYLDDGRQRLTYDDGRARDIPFKAGQALWDPAGEYHVNENTGGTAFRVVEVELKKPDGAPFEFPPLDPVKVDPRHYTVEMDNGQVRVIRFRCGPREQMPMHEHPLPRVIVFLTDFSVRVTRPDGSTAESNGRVGDVGFPPTARHSEVSLRDAPTELIAVELKTK